MRWDKDLDTRILSEALKRDGTHTIELINIVFALSGEGKPNKKTIRRHIRRLVQENFLMIRYSVIVFVTAKGNRFLVEERSC